MSELRLRIPWVWTFTADQMYGFISSCWATNRATAGPALVYLLRSASATPLPFLGVRPPL
ncbi:MAG: hypothetical protein KIT69_02165 [Propionibacteriaceae bacterium]|nr:hypothetical protein [Propionibacteriaceae bacterium]